ncbi:MAG TPA: hypothetical protein VEZ11_12535 [Thermoanaerobaculia bacterium]|nr:hypothetical protein [Thermoanaerobaculia bacterium]
MTATLRISDLAEGILAFGLADLLEILGEAAVKSTWRCEVGEFVPKPGVKYLREAWDAMAVVDGAILFQVAANTLQVCSGRFEAFATGSPHPWLTLEAFESTWWEITSTDEDTLLAIEPCFKSVERIERAE